MSLQDLKKLTDQLHEQDDVFQAIASFATDGFWDWKIAEDYEYMSPTFWKILGYDHKDKKHHPSEWQKCIHPEDAADLMVLLESHIASSGRVPFISKCRYRHGVTGHWVTVLCRGKVIRWDGDRAVRMVGTHTLLDG